MKKKIKEYYLYIIIFVIFLLIGLFVPTGGDDWEISSWYNNEGLFGLLCKSITKWASFNGRILNNFFDMFLSKYEVLWAFSSSFIHTLTIFISLKIIKQEKNKNVILLLLLMVLSVSVGFRQEVQIHKIGNISYSIPTCLIFMALYLLFNKKDKNDKKDYYLIMFLSLCCCLWIENLTISFSLINFLLLIIDYIKTKKINKYLLFSSLGCFFGCLILFSSPGFLNRYSTETGGLSTIQLIKNNYPILLSQITFEQGFIYIIYSLICIVLLFQKNKNVLFKLYYILLFLYILFSNTILIFSNYNARIQNLYLKLKPIFFNNKNILVIITSLSVLASIAIMINMFANKKEKKILYLLYLLAMFSMAPMVLAPGNRNIILVLYSLFTINAFLFSKIHIKNNKYAIILIIIALIFRLENYHYVLNNAHKIELERIKIINNFKRKNESDNKDLILPVYEKGIISNLNSNYYDISFRKYYMLNDDTNIIYKDNFMYKSITNNENTVEVVLLKDDKFNYNYEVYEEGMLIFKEKSDENKLNYDFKNGVNYKVKITIINSNNKTLEKEVEVYNE